MMSKNKTATLMEVARLAGVCRSAAGKVLNGTGGSIRVGSAARERVTEAARKLKYRPNMAGAVLAGGDSRLIGVILDSQGHYRNLRLLIELEALCTENGYQLLTCFSHDNPRVMSRNYSMLMRYGVTGVICCAHDYPGLISEVEAIFDDGGRVVFMEKPEFEAENYVETKRTNAFRKMISSALASGYRRIGAVHGDSIWSSERKLRNEFRQALSDCGIEPDDRFLYQYSEEAGTAERCGEAMRRLILPQKPDFLFVHDAPSAVFLQNLIREAGLEVTLHGGDDDPVFSGFLPRTGSLDPHYRRIAELLFETASGKRPECRETVETVFRRNSIRRKR
ncbi:MAG: HTH-type transcriptional regulator DegA [Lentisphaerae bacterium ADurb.Bin242]|nr:MAG: HTH-type transcriptional regulator DegA [Lentisphaerae bacterium ADurb.Bin242]